MAIERGASGEFQTGWTLLLAGMLGCCLGVSALPIYTAGVFIPHLEKDFGWGRAELSLAILLFTLALAVASPVVGRVIDRFGVRRTVAVSIVGASSLYVVLAFFLSGLALFYAGHILIAAVGAAAAPIAYTRVITNHFARARGLALGITLLGPSLAATIGPPLVSAAIDRGGWSGGYLMLAALIAAMLPFLFLLRDNTPAVPVTLEGAPVTGPLYSAPQLRRIFVILFCAFAFFALAIGGLLIHFVPMLTDAGLSGGEAAATAGLIGLSGMIGRVAGGAAADRFFAPYVLILISCAAVTGFALLAVSGAAYAAIAAVTIGFSLGAEADLMAYLVSRYFGREGYARAFGWLYAAFIAGAGISPLILGFLYDRFGNYVIGLWAGAVLLAVTMILFTLLPRFRDKV